MSALSSVCSRCGATIRWVRTRNGKAMPVTTPVAGQPGNVAAMADSRGRYVDAYEVTTAEQRAAAIAASYRIFRPHFADCRPTPPPAAPGTDRLF